MVTVAGVAKPAMSGGWRHRRSLGEFPRRLCYVDLMHREEHPSKGS